MSRHAFVDESFDREFLMAAAVVPAGDVNAARAVIRGLLRSGQRRIHFKDERPQRRDVILAALSVLDITATVYVTKNRREARGLCLTRMVPDLAAVGVTRLIVERDDSLLPFDRRTLAAVTRQHCPDLEYAHLKAYDDLLLVLPDAIAWCWAKGGRWRARVAGYTTEQVL